MIDIVRRNSLLVATGGDGVIGDDLPEHQSRVGEKPRHW